MSGTVLSAGETAVTMSADLPALGVSPWSRKDEHETVEKPGGGGGRETSIQAVLGALRALSRNLPDPWPREAP